MNYSNKYVVSKDENIDNYRYIGTFILYISDISVDILIQNICEPKIDQKL